MTTIKGGYIYVYTAIRNACTVVVMYLQIFLHIDGQFADLITSVFEELTTAIHPRVVVHDSLHIESPFSCGCVTLALMIQIVQVSKALFSCSLQWNAV